MKKMGKILALSFASLMFLSVLASFVAAQGIEESVASVVSSIAAVTKPIFDLIVGENTAPGEGVIAVLTFFLVTLVVYGVLDGLNLFSSRSWINVVIGIIVSLIGIRLISNTPGILTQMAFPSAALAGGLLLIIPFIIVGVMIIRLGSPMLRRVLWTIYAVLVGVLWIYNLDNAAMKPVWYIYPLIIVACAIAFFFDSIVKKLFKRAKKEKETEEAVEEIENTGRQRLLEKIDLAERELSSGAAKNPDQKKAYIERLRNQLKYMK